MPNFASFPLTFLCRPSAVKNPSECAISCSSNSFCRVVLVAAFGIIKRKSQESIKGFCSVGLHPFNLSLGDTEKIHPPMAADGHFAKSKMSYGEQELAFLSCVRAALSQQPVGRVPTPPAPWMDFF